MLISEQFDTRERELLARAAAKFTTLFDDYRAVLPGDMADAAERAARLVATDRDARAQAATLNQAATVLAVSEDGVQLAIAGMRICIAVQVTDDGYLELMSDTRDLGAAVILADRCVGLRHMVAGEDVAHNLYDVDQP